MPFASHSGATPGWTPSDEEAVVKIEANTPVGATVRDVDLTRVDTAHDVDRIRDALAEHGVLAVPDQHRLDDDGFAGFLRRLGRLQFTDGEVPVEGRDDLNIVTNVGRERAPVSNWHVDTAYVASPPSYTALRAVTVPRPRWRDVVLQPVPGVGHVGSAHARPGGGAPHDPRGHRSGTGGRERDRSGSSHRAAPPPAAGDVHCSSMHLHGARASPTSTSRRLVTSSRACWTGRPAPTTCRPTAGSHMMSSSGTTRSSCIAAITATWSVIAPSIAAW